jgi:aminoacyl-tRNA hydrolase
MNETGWAVTRLLAYHKLQPAQMIAVHDELDIDPGQLRVKFGGGDNGHNGLRSIRASLGTGDFYRVRVGVGRPPGRQEPADFLLSNFPASTREDVEVEISRAADAVESPPCSGWTGPRTPSIADAEMAACRVPNFSDIPVRAFAPTAVSAVRACR